MRVWSMFALTLAGCGDGFDAGFDTKDAGPGSGGPGPASSSSAVGGGEAGSGGYGSGPGGWGGGGQGSVSSSSAASSSTGGGEGGETSSGGQGGSGCVPKTCTDLGKDCGDVDDGCGAQIDCGLCVAPDSCGGGGTPNVCGGCTPKTCASENVLCGTLDDGCGNLLDCGDYKYWQICNYGAPLYTCDCPMTHLYSVTCVGDNLGSSPPPYPTCIVNPAPDGGGTWCCNEGQLP